jgi:hypothetical protein
VRPQNGGRSPPPDARNDLPNEPPTKALANAFNVSAVQSQGAGPIARPSPKAALDLVDELRFDALCEASALAISHVQLTLDAAATQDLLKARLYACAASRSVRSMLQLVGELCQRAA